MTVLVTGGTGLIGSHVAEVLLREGHVVRVLSRTRGRHENLAHIAQHVQMCHGEFGDERTISEATDGVDEVIHLAWTTVPEDSSHDPLSDIRDNVIGTVNLLNACVSNGVRRFVFISTGGAVYGDADELPVSEAHPLDPISSYGITKLATEKYLRFYLQMYDLDFRTLRVANAYGERQMLGRGQGIIGIWLDKLKHGLPLEIIGDGEIVRDYVHVSDVAEAFAKVIRYDGSERVFNVGFGEGHSVNELLSLIETVTGLTPERVHSPARRFDVDTNVLDISLARRELNWQPRITLHEGVERIWAQLQ